MAGGPEDKSRKNSIFAWLGAGAALVAILGFFAGVPNYLLERKIKKQLNGIIAGAYWCDKSVNSQNDLEDADFGSFGTFIVNLETRSVGAGPVFETTGKSWTARNGKTAEWKVSGDFLLERDFTLKQARSGSDEKIHVRIPLIGPPKFKLSGATNDCHWMTVTKVPNNSTPAAEKGEYIGLN